MKYKEWKEKEKRLYDYLNKLYFSGRLGLQELNSFRELLKEINQIMENITFRMKFFVGNIFGAEQRNTEIEKLNSEILLLEYNVSLLSCTI